MKKILCVMLTVVVILSTVLAYANGFIVTSNNTELIFTKGILYEEEMLYLPLEELLDILLIDEGLKKEGIKFSLYIENDMYPDIYNMEIDKKEIVYTQEPVTFAPATRETKYAPILKDGSIYIPFEFVEYIVPFEKYGLEWVNKDSSEKGMNCFFWFIISVTILSLLAGIYTLSRAKANGIIQIVSAVVFPILTFWFCSLKKVRAYGGTDTEFLIHSATVDGDILAWIIFILFVVQVTFIIKTIFSVVRGNKVD